MRFTKISKISLHLSGVRCTCSNRVIPQYLKEKLKQLVFQSKKVGLQIYINKTKSIQDKESEDVEQFCNLSNVFQ